MESALADGRYEEAAYLRDDYRKTLQEQAAAAAAETADSTTESSRADQRKLL